MWIFKGVGYLLTNWDGSADQARVLAFNSVENWVEVLYWEGQTQRMRYDHFVSIVDGESG